MANRISHEQRKLIIRLLCEGSSIRSIARITGCHKNTVANVIIAFGSSAQIFLDDVLHGLTLDHIQVDEMHTFVAKKQKRLTIEERASRGDIGDMYLWLAIDQETKLIAAHLVGKRSADNARRLMVDLANRLSLPKAGSADDHAFVKGSYKPVTQISTDGFAAYPEATDLAFGPHATHGVLIKEYRNRNEPGRYAPAEMISTIRKSVRGIKDEWSICTSHVERQNLTVRTLMKRFNRLTLGFSKKLEALECAVSLYIAFYNFVWRTRHTDYSGKPGKLRPTAAMMAKVTDHLWSFNEFYETVIRYN